MKNIRDLIRSECENVELQSNVSNERRGKSPEDGLRFEYFSRAYSFSLSTSGMMVVNLAAMVGVAFVGAVVKAHMISHIGISYLAL